MANSTIKHSGIVSKLTPQGVEVNIAVSSACAGCHAGSSCGMADNKARVIQVSRPHRRLSVGEQVEIEGAQSTGLGAVFFAYILPFLITMLTLILSLALFHTNELRAGLYALLVLPLYYLVLYLFRGKFEKKYTFRIVS